MTADVVVRCGKADDVDAMLALEEVFPSDRMSRRSVQHFLKAPTARVLVAESASDAMLGNVIGLRRAHSRAMRIYSLVVAADARGLGIGQKLVAALETLAANEACDRVTLEVRADNAAARALYAKLGYRETEALPGYYEDGSDGLRLSRAIG
ncbi:N-acetyltransferase [Nevskia sp.]|uniref:GNAT family N-acetyltransferase n=1 Tax=Nevskia sp. TaxID=1929292 RepID=UPI0025D0A335|nr:N-acetyltransferase [Nevskia sp.]